MYLIEEQKEPKNIQSEGTLAAFVVMTTVIAEIIKVLDKEGKANELMHEFLRLSQKIDEDINKVGDQDE